MQNKSRNQMDNGSPDVGILDKESPGRKCRKVFISHCSNDTHQAERLRRGLEAVSEGEVTCYLSTGRQLDDAPDSKKPYRRWIRQWISDSTSVVCLYTPEALSSHWVNYELGLADAMDKHIFMLHLAPAALDIGKHPLEEFQWAKKNETQIKKMLLDIVKHAGVHDPSLAKARDEALALLKAIDRGLGDRSDVYGDEDHLEWINGRVNDFDRRAHELLRTLDPPEEERKYVSDFRDAVGKLDPGDRIMAVCGDKDWVKDVYMYMNENIRAARENGVAVRRIFIEPSHNSFKDEEWSVIACHRAWEKAFKQDEAISSGAGHFEIGVLIGPKAKQAHDSFALPPGFGCVILDSLREPGPRVWIHHGLRSGQRWAREFRSGVILAVYKALHKQLWNERIDGEKLDDLLRERKPKEIRDLEHP